MRKTTLSAYKKAIRQDGNLTQLECDRRLRYALNQIEYSKRRGEVTYKTAQLLELWAYSEFE